MYYKKILAAALTVPIAKIDNINVINKLIFFIFPPMID